MNPIPTRLTRARSRALLLPVAALGGFSLLRLWHAAAAPLGTDFALAVTYCRVVLAHGWRHAYDPVALEAARRSVEPLGWWPNVYTPYQLALTVPFAALPLGLGAWLWSLLLLAATVTTALLVVSTRSIGGRVAGVLVALSLPPVLQAFHWLQPVPVVAAAVALAWWLERRGHPVLAGVALAALAIKPQLAWLVPVALLAAGRVRSVLAWASASSVLAGIALALVGWTGIAAWLGNLADASAHPQAYLVFGNFGLAPLLPRPWAFVFQAGVALITAAAGWRSRSGSGGPYAAGLAGSLAATTFVHPQDWAMVGLGAGIALSTIKGAGTRRFAVALYVAGLAGLGSFYVPLALAVVAWIIWLALRPTPDPRDAPARASAGRLIHQASR